jgi:hypothetical protein
VEPGKLVDFLVAERMAEDISHEGLRALLREHGVSLERLKTFKASERSRPRGQTGARAAALRDRRRTCPAATG